jgi:tetratricopeptide (TPR) repeat protein
VLEYGYGKFDYSDDISNKLAEYYMFYEKDLDKGFKILQHAYNLFPNNTQILESLLKYYEQKNDPVNEARIAYLIGLRRHSPKHYQLAVKIYLDLNQLQLANKALRKLVRLKEDDPLTLLFTSRYLDLKGQRSKVLGVLNTALILSNKLGDKQDINVTKSILVSLINVHATLGNLSYAKQFLSVFEGIKDLTPQDQLQIKATKKLLEEFESKRSLKSVSRP